MLHVIALELTTHRHADAATQVLERSVTWQRARPAADAGLPHARFRLGRDLLELGETAEARRLFATLVQEETENLSCRAYLGLAAARAGDRSGAEEGMSWLGVLERPYLFGLRLHHGPHLRRLRGYPPFEEMLRPKGGGRR